MQSDTEVNWQASMNVLVFDPAAGTGLMETTTTTTSKE